MSLLKSIFKKKEKEKRDIREDLEKLGLTVLTDERLRERLEGYEDFYEYVNKYTGILSVEEKEPEKKLESMNQFVHNVNKIIQHLAIPWGRGGDERWFAEIIDGWSTLYSITLDFITSVNHMFSSIERERAKLKEKLYEPERLKEELIRKLLSFIQKFYVRYALKIVGTCWREKDVTPSWSITLQAMPSSPYPPSPIRTYDTGSPIKKVEER